jgi:hypothetical protein
MHRELSVKAACVTNTRQTLAALVGIVYECCVLHVAYTKTQRVQLSTAPEAAACSIVISTAMREPG